VSKPNFNIRVDKEIVDKFKKQANKEKRSCGEIVRQLIVEYLKKNE
jgi:predicted HicB family RNase H-like nuclease